MSGDRDVHRRGARAARPLTGQLDYIRTILENALVRIDSAARDADAQAQSRWVHAELGHLREVVEHGVARCVELRADMMHKGLSPHALAAPIELKLSKSAPLMPIETTAIEETPRLVAGSR